MSKTKSKQIKLIYFSKQIWFVINICFSGYNNKNDYWDHRIQQGLNINYDNKKVPQLLRKEKKHDCLYNLFQYV